MTRYGTSLAMSSGTAAATSTNAGSVVRMYSTNWRTEWCIDEGSLADVSYQANRPFSATYDEYLFLEKQT